MTAPLDTPDTPDTPLLHAITLEVPPAVAHKLSEWHDGTLEHAALTALRLYHGMGPDAYAQLLQAATTLGTTPNKALRTAIAQLHTQAHKLTPPAAPRGRPVTNQERDTAIYLRVSEGATHAEVSHAFDISIVRIGQILAQQRAMRGVEPSRARKVQPKATEADATDVSTLFAAMDAGMATDTAATTYSLTTEQVTRAYAAYREALPEDTRPTKGDKVSAAFAGLHALQNPNPEPKALSLKVPTPPAQPQPQPPAPQSLAETDAMFDDLMQESGL
jgi:hypothetical protein